MSEGHEGTREPSGARRTRRARWQQWRSERGAALVEAAIVLPVVLTLLLGVMEFGFIWKDDLAIANGVHTAVRIGAADGSAQYADYDILQQLKSGTTALPTGAVIAVIVWEANANNTVPTSCTALIGSDANPNASSGVSGLCNYYRGTDVTGLTQASFTNSCTTGPDHYWCPSSRLHVLSGSAVPDLVGVYIRINHNYVTRILGTSRTLSDQAIMRIEPQ